MEPTIHTEVDRKALSLVAPLLEPIAKEAEFRPTDDGGWRTYAYSSAGDRAVEVEIPRYAFSDQAPDVSFCIDLEDLAKACKLAKGDTIAMDIGAKVTFSSGTMKYSAPTNAAIRGPRKHPSAAAEMMPFTAEVMVSPLQIGETLKAADAKKVDEARISVSETGLDISAEDELRGVSLGIPAAELDVLDGTASAAYHLRSLQEMFDAIPKSVVCDIRLGNDFPMVITFEAGKLKGLYLIAPRITMED